MTQLNDFLSNPAVIQNPNAANGNPQIGIQNPTGNERQGLMHRLFGMRRGNGPEQAQTQGQERVPQNQEQLERYVADGAKRAGISEQEFAKSQGIAPKEPPQNQGLRGIFGVRRQNDAT